MSGVTFTVLGEPRPQGSKRIGRTSTGRPLILDQADGRLRTWRQEVGWAAKGAMDGVELLDGPLTVRATFRLIRPISVSERRRPMPSVKPDVDKLTRSLLDACTGVVWRDDAQVVALDIVKIYGEPGVTVSVTPYPTATQAAAS